MFGVAILHFHRRNEILRTAASSMNVQLVSVKHGFIPYFIHQCSVCRFKFLFYYIFSDLQRMNLKILDEIFFTPLKGLSAQMFDLFESAYKNLHT